MSHLEKLDAIIVGGGPAGISCALELQDSRRTYVLLEGGGRLGGQLADVANTIHNFPGGFYENGEDLLAKMESLVERTSCSYLLHHEVTQADLINHRIVAAGKEFIASTVVLATGYRRRRLNLAGSERFGNQVTYHHHECLDGAVEPAVAVIGGGDNALLDALELAAVSPQVYLIHRSTSFRARPDVIREVCANQRIKLFLNSEVESLLGSDKLAGLRIICKATGAVSELTVGRLVIKIGFCPNTQLFQGQVEMDETGHVLIDPDCSTSCPGVFAVGDITAAGYPRLSTAAGHGVMAAAAIRRLIEPALMPNDCSG